VVFDSNLYFSAQDGSNGFELWKSDGSAGGTTLVQDIYAGATGSNPLNMTVLGSELFFSASDASNGNELWKLSASGSASLVQDINPGTSSSSPYGITAWGNNLIFSAVVGLGIEPYIYQAPQ
jgi:ELWxxDGT repeat protein